ncbi:hypothetical protein ACH4E8_26670 [Streptomyces sp. NPDC017979]|uniref:hypothetical protein n=1 Tax=Streptomyces sp. NPDC017979 TaxID=3365024 RepID=UPI0037A58A9C
MRKKRVTAGLAVAAVVVGGGVYYAAGGPPFGADATVSAGQMCKQVGPAEAAAEVLNKALPASGSYAVGSNTTKSRIDDRDGYTTYCSVDNADKRSVFDLQVEMRRYDSVDDWFAHAAIDEDYLPKGEVRKFGPEDRGRLSPRAGMFLLPCASKEQSPGGQRDLHVSLRFPKGTRVDSTDASREAVKELLIATVKQSHTDAKCDLPLALS